MKNTQLTTREDRGQRLFLLLIITAIALVLMAFNYLPI